MILEELLRDHYMGGSGKHPEGSGACVTFLKIALFLSYLVFSAYLLRLSSMGAAVNRTLPEKRLSVSIVRSVASRRGFYHEQHARRDSFQWIALAPPIDFHRVHSFPNWKRPWTKWSQICLLD
jgi:hypothetical protein